MLKHSTVAPNFNYSSENEKKFRTNFFGGAVVVECLTLSIPYRTVVMVEMLTRLEL